MPAVEGFLEGDEDQVDEVAVSGRGDALDAVPFIACTDLVGEVVDQGVELDGGQSSGCGFSSRATFVPEVHPTVVWAKFAALSEGAALATSRLR